MSYTATGLNDVAEFFETLASDQRASVRWQARKKDKEYCEVRARTWEEAARILRETTLAEVVS
jgi:hypothetical protein